MGAMARGLSGGAPRLALPLAFIFAIFGASEPAQAGRPVVILTMLSRSFFMPTSEGVVDPANDEHPEPSQRHALVAVGHGTVDGATAILVRNSWGAGWGIDGHAWLTERFLAPRLFATANLMEAVDVSSSTLAA